MESGDSFRRLFCVSGILSLSGVGTANTLPVRKVHLRTSKGNNLDNPLFYEECDAGSCTIVFDIYSYKTAR